MFCFVCFWKTGEASEKPNTVIFEAMPKTSTQRVAWEDAVDADDDDNDVDNDDNDDWLAFKSQQQTKLWLFWQRLSTVVIHTPRDQSAFKNKLSCWRTKLIVTRISQTDSNKNRPAQV